MQQPDFFLNSIPSQIDPRLADSSRANQGYRFGKKYTKAQCRHGAIKVAALKREAVIGLIERHLPAYCLSCEDNDQRFTMAGFFRAILPTRNAEWLRNSYGSYIRGRVEALFERKCHAVNRFRDFVLAIRAALKRRPVSEMVREWLRLGPAISSNPYRTSLHRTCTWRDHLRIWEFVEPVAV